MKFARILIVEDDPMATAILSSWAYQQGATVVAVSNFAEAETVLARGSVDLVVSDVHLPGNDRLEWVEKLLAVEFPPPIVLVTGNPGLETTLRAANLPVAGYLVKPPDLAALTRLAQAQISAYRLRRELRELSRDTACLLVESGWETGQARDKLLQLSRLLAAESGRNPPPSGSVDDRVFRAAISETVAVLEKTKDSFRSKDLGRLRRRLQELLNQAQAA